MAPNVSRTNIGREERLTSAKHLFIVGSKIGWTKTAGKWYAGPY